MPLILRKDTLFDHLSNEITYFLPTATQEEKQIVKNGDDLIDLIGEFMIGYDETKHVSKKLFDKLKNL